MTKDFRDIKSWISVAKICAVLGVVIQHVNGYVYSNDYLLYSVWWTVSLFVMIGGYNALASYENRGIFLLKKKLLGIIIPYFFATSLYSIYKYHYLSTSQIIDNLIHFDAIGPLYYVAVYIQLLLISPVLIAVIRICNNLKWLYLLMGGLVFGISILTTHCTNLFEIETGGGNLFAGPWLVFWVLGMCIKNWEKSIEIDSKVLKWIVIVLTIAILAWQHIFVNMGINLRLSSMFHSAQVGMTWANAFETVLIFFFFKYSVELYENNAGKIGCAILWPFNYMGRYTLYIFLYHMLFLSIYKEYLEIPDYGINRWFCLVFIVVGPIVLGSVFLKLKAYLRMIMEDVKIE